MDQGSTMKRSAVHNVAPTVTKFCVMWEGQALPHDTKFGNSRCEIVGRRVIFIWSLIHGLRWSGLIKAEPGWLFNSLLWPLGDGEAILDNQLQSYVKDRYLEQFLWNYLWMNATIPQWSLVNIGSVNGLVPSRHQAITWISVDKVI